MEGFCSPRKLSSAPSYDDLLEEEVADKYAPDLEPQTPMKESQDSSIASPEPSEIKEDTSEATPELTANEIVTEALTANETEASTEEKDDNTKPELDVSKTMVENRKKRGIGNFIMACLFLFGTMLALNKLGYTAPIFDLSAGGSGGDGSIASWIHIFEKPTAMEKEPESEEESITEATVDEL